MNREIKRDVPSGYLMIPLLLTAQIGLAYAVIRALQSNAVVVFLVAVFASIVVLVCWAGFMMVHPNEAKVLQLFGKYVGTTHEPGLRWANPLYSKVSVSTRVRNFESSTLKVNDANGSPIEIAAVVVWKVFDTAEALFEVDDYAGFVQIQSESALRNLGTTYPYEPHDGEEIALRSNQNEIAEALVKEVQDRLTTAGVSVVEARITHLAYAPEVANAMLRRQQASAIIAARKLIVRGAVGMVQLALHELDENNIVKLDEERKAAMVSNLLVVLCSDESAQPVLNTGSLYT